MVRLTREERERALAFLEKMLSVKSVNGQNRELDAAEALDDYFSDTGYERQIQRTDERRGNFIAEVPGGPSRNPGGRGGTEAVRDKGSGYVVWNGHLDTVPYGDPEAWSSDPAVPVIRDGRIYGRGTSDMKGGLCAMAFALHYLHDHGLRPRETVRFAATCDEEKGGAGAEALLREGWFGTPDFLLIGEPTDNQIGIAQKGCLWLSVTVKGKTSHGAYPWTGVNAAELGYEFCRRVKELVSGSRHPILGAATAAVTRAEGGVANNMIPDEMHFVMDIRSVPGVSHEELEEAMREQKVRMEQEYPGLSIAWETLNERRSVELLPGHPRAEALRRTLSAVIGETPKDIGVNFFTDASVLLKEAQVPTLLFGPGDPALCHKPDESMELENYYRAIEVYLGLLLEE